MDNKNLVARRNLLAVLTASFLTFMPMHVPAATEPDWGIGYEPSTCSPFIKNHDRIMTVMTLRAHVQEHMFAQLEKDLACLMDENYFLNSGEAGSSIVASFFNSVYEASDRNAIVRGLEAWREYNSDSEFYKFHLLHESYRQAWEYRGNKWVKDTPAENFEKFHTALTETQNDLLDPYGPLSGTAVSANLLLAVSLDMRQPLHDPLEIYQSSATQWPAHYRFHTSTLFHLVPKWGGSWELVDIVIASISDYYQPQSGQAMYAKLYEDLHNSHQLDPRETLVTWDKLKPALIDWMNHEVNHNTKIITASYACLYNDMALYEMYRPADLAHYYMLIPDRWVKGTNWEICESKLNDAQSTNVHD